MSTKESKKPAEEASDGKKMWLAQRAKWNASSKVNEDDIAQADNDEEYYDYDCDDPMSDEDLDAEQIIYCLRQYRRFPDPISLSTIVRLLNILWDDEFM